MAIHGAPTAHGVQQLVCCAMRAACTMAPLLPDPTHHYAHQLVALYLVPRTTGQPAW